MTTAVRIHQLLKESFCIKLPEILNDTLVHSLNERCQICRQVQCKDIATNKFRSWCICTAVIQQEYSLALLRQSLLSELFYDCGHRVVKESVLEKFCSHSYFVLTIIDNRNMLSIPKMPWFCELISRRKFRLMASIALTHKRTVILSLLYLI